MTMARSSTTLSKSVKNAELKESARSEESLDMVKRSLMMKRESQKGFFLRGKGEVLFFLCFIESQCGSL